MSGRRHGRRYRIEVTGKKEKRMEERKKNERERRREDLSKKEKRKRELKRRLQKDWMKGKKRWRDNGRVYNRSERKTTIRIRARKTIAEHWKLTEGREGNRSVGMWERRMKV